MELIPAESPQRARWNEFVTENFPLVGAFFQTWEWGEFQKSLGLRISRYIISENDSWCGIFLLVERDLPFGLQYCYLPRGPVLDKKVWEDERRLKEIFSLIEETLRNDFGRAIFVRFEPPVRNVPVVFEGKNFKLPHYYIQPRYNAVLDVRRPETELLRLFHPAMRHNIRLAERKGVSVVFKTALDTAEREMFRHMRIETAGRAGKGIYPGGSYFDRITSALAPMTRNSPHGSPHFGFSVAYHENTPSSLHLNIFFADTVTYLFGATLTSKLRYKVAPYIHWASIREAKRLGFERYDFGGIDEKRWPTLTYFKKQFGTEVVAYMGNADLIMRSFSYKVYNVLRRLRHHEAI